MASVRRPCSASTPAVSSASYAEPRNEPVNFAPAASAKPKYASPRPYHASPLRGASTTARRYHVAGLLRFPQRMVRAPQSQCRLRIVRIEFPGCQQVRRRFPRVVQLHEIETEKQIGNEQRPVQTQRRAERFRRLGVFAGLVLHQPEIAPEFGDVRTDRHGLAIAGRGAAKIAPGLRLMGLGQERFQPGVPIRLRNSQSRSRQGNCD